MPLRSLLQSTRVIPVITIDKLADAAPLAKALVEGGLNCLELTLRTPVAFEALKAMKEAAPEAIIGVGTVLESKQLEQAKALGAQFAVSPGLTETLVRAALAVQLPYLPGTATLSEVMMGRELGLSVVKFFPAEIAGGAKALKAFAPLFGDMKFVPTGGISPSNAKDYLSLPNVLAVGGSWMLPADLIRAQAWDEIRELARAASQL
jgi:2-dehydro-3-deoxyphosphogluconate aldolase / (4S)-4-hydroxy-2-oxoglutarate aldolase